MTKSELIARLAARNPHLYQRDVERIVATVFGEISKALASGHRVELRGFGAFSVKKRDPRTGRNPRTGEQVAVASKRVPYFKTGKDLRDRLNKEAAQAAIADPRGAVCNGTARRAFVGLMSDRPPPWRKPPPKSARSGHKLSPQQKAAAQARAKRAGRRYPNLVDNMWAATKAGRT